MEDKQPYITLLEAPSGYGKTYNLNKISFRFKALKVNYIHQNQEFINSLIISFHTNKMDCPLSTQLTDWYKYFKNLKHQIVIVIDDFDLINDKFATEFINFFVINQCPNIHFIISSSIKLNLSKPVNLLTNCCYLNTEQLAFNEISFKELWSENKLKITKADIEFLFHCKGWNLAIVNYLRCKKNQIDKNELNRMTEQSIEYLFKDIDNIFSDKNAELLKSRFIDKKNWSDLVFNYFAQKYKNSFEYWLFISLNKSNDIEKTITYLHRALKICESQKKSNEILQIYNRLINFYTINSDYENVDLIIQEAEKFVEVSNISEVSVYMYLKANRMRQLTKYKDGIELLEKLISLKSEKATVLKFQTKAYILLGLIEYQIGNYTKTKEAYQKAIYLTEGENNFVLKTEISIMLTFLNAWEGKDNELLPENIINVIESFELKDQPMMWLNLAFYWILGEKIDIEIVELIINKIENINEILKYNFLIPLIADIKARLMRFKGEYDSAFYYHKLALNNLSTESFEYIHAYLNMGLSLLKTGKIKEAESVFKEVYEKSQKSNSLGLAKEAEILLRQIDPEFMLIKSNDNSNQISFVEEENNNSIGIEFFGGFNVNIDNKNIKWTRKKAKNLLINLILSPKGIHRETLAEILFPDDDNPLKNLDVHIHLIRKIFDINNSNKKDKENSIIVFQNSCYFLNKNFKFYSDLKSFELIYSDWSESENIQNKLLLSKKLIEIYKGEFLPEIDFSEQWLSEREYYRKKIINVLKFAINNNIENIEYFAEKLLLIDPFETDNYILYMKSISPNKILLKNIYKRYSDMMFKELALEPDSSLNNLYEELLKK